MIFSAATAYMKPRWLEGKPTDRYSAVGDLVTVQFAEQPEVVWMFSARLPKDIAEAREWVSCRNTEK